MTFAIGVLARGYFEELPGTATITLHGTGPGASGIAGRVSMGATVLTGDSTAAGYPDSTNTWANTPNSWNYLVKMSSNFAVGEGAGSPSPMEVWLRAGDNPAWDLDAPDAATIGGPGYGVASIYISRDGITIERQWSIAVVWNKVP